MLSREEILAVYETGPEAVVAVVEGLQAQQAELMAQVQTLTVRMQALEARLNQDSHNSHKPPPAMDWPSCHGGAAGVNAAARLRAGKPAISGSPCCRSLSRTRS